MGKLRAAAVRTYGQASRALRELALLLGSDAARGALSQRNQVEAAYADLTPAERQSAPRWLKAAAIAAAIGTAIFDTYLFQHAFLNIMQVRASHAWLTTGLGLETGFVLALGLITAGRLLAGPIWRLRQRRPASPGGSPIRPILGAGALALALVAAAMTPIFVFAGGYPGLLLLSLAFVVFVLETLVYNPYQADLRRAERAVRQLAQTGRCGSRGRR